MGEPAEIVRQGFAGLVLLMGRQPLQSWLSDLVKLLALPYAIILRWSRWLQTSPT